MVTSSATKIRVPGSGKRAQRGWKWAESRGDRNLLDRRKATFLLRALAGLWWSWTVRRDSRSASSRCARVRWIVVSVVAGYRRRRRPGLPLSSAAGLVSTSLCPDRVAITKSDDRSSTKANVGAYNVDPARGTRCLPQHYLSAQNAGRCAALWSRPSCSNRPLPAVQAGRSPFCVGGCVGSNDRIGDSETACPVSGCRFCAEFPGTATCVGNGRLLARTFPGPRWP